MKWIPIDGQAHNFIYQMISNCWCGVSFFSTFQLFSFSAFQPGVDHMTAYFVTSNQFRLKIFQSHVGCLPYIYWWHFDSFLFSILKLRSVINSEQKQKILLRGMSHSESDNTSNFTAHTGDGSKKKKTIDI